MSEISGLVSFRPGQESDAYDTFVIFERAYSDLLRRLGSTESTSASHPDRLAKMWAEREPLYIHLTRSADQFWIAEKDGKPIGFSRSIVRGRLRELTELFVLPGQQSGGIGRELIQRAFPEDESDYRAIIATTDVRAQVLYLKAGVYPRFSMNYFGKEPASRNVSADLDARPMETITGSIDLVGSIDEIIIGHRRDADHEWLMQDRTGVLFHHHGQLVGYGYLGLRNGPFALLSAENYPSVLAHAENHAFETGLDHFGVEVPMMNQHAVDYLLANGFQLDSFMALMMTNKPFGKFGNYIATSPPFFM